MGQSWRDFPHGYRRWVVAGGLLLLLTLAGAVLLVSTGLASWGGAPAGEGIRAGDLTLSGADFSTGESSGPLRKDAGVALTMAANAVYTSPILLAPLPFSDYGCAWTADVPPGRSLLLEVRTSRDVQGDRWTPWQQVIEEYELPPLPAGQYGGKLLSIPQQDGVHQRLQYRLSLSVGEGGVLPRLDRLTFTFIDARAGPSTQEIMARQGKGTVSGFARPVVIARTEWGCPEGESSPRWLPKYEAVTHVIIHHTATPNDDVDWAARVRAIWYYHADTRGWGDIGYNYLIDPLGNVYEGRAGGDDVIGGHSYDYNPGTMGVGNLGTYSAAPVPAPLQQSLEFLIAWEAAQRGIDPLGSSFNNYKVYDNIAGHRDVGQTSCPGDVLYGLIPTIREDVYDLLQQQGQIAVVDEQGAGFTGSPAYWHDGCGYDNHSVWTHTTIDPGLSTNWGIWRPALLEAGLYEVFAYVPSCTGEGLPDYTHSAHYRIYYQGGGSAVTVDQQAEQGHWVSLGTYEFAAGTAGYVYLDDLADDDWLSLWYDAVRWTLRVPVLKPPPAPILQAPFADAWVNSRQVTFQWTVPATATVDGIRLVVATDPALTQRIAGIDVGLFSQYVLVLTGDYPAVYWSVQAHNTAGTGPFAQVRSFGVDTTPPTSFITALYRTTTGIYILRWSGTDAGSGVASYTVQVRDGLLGPWQDLWRDTPWTSGVVEIPEGVTRYFRVQARDRLGNEEALHGGDGDLSSVSVTPLNWSWYFPLLLRAFVSPTSPPQPTATPPPPAPTARPTPTLPAIPSETPTAGPTLTPSPSPPPVPTPTPTRMPSPTPQPPAEVASLPDLVVVAIHSSQDSPFDCGRPTGIAVEVSNRGMTPAGPFDLVLQGLGLTECRWHLDGLAAGEHAERVCPGIVVATLVTAQVDAENQVAESDEANNILEVSISVLALPTCTPAATP